MPNPAPVQLLVCTTCRSAKAPADPAIGAEAPRPGAVLLERLLAGGVPEGTEIRPVECLSNCTRGCTIALRGAGRWTYIYGNLDPDTDVAIAIEGAERYRATADGLVPWRERPVHFRKNCIARIPPVELPRD